MRKEIGKQAKESEKVQSKQMFMRKVKARCHISCRSLSHFLVFMCVFHRQDLYLRQRINFGPVCLFVCSCLYVCAYICAMVEYSGILLCDLNREKRIECELKSQ